MNGVITCFGEIMARIQPEGFNRIRQGFPGKADISFAGAEANVSASLQMLGRETRYVSALPNGPLGDAALDAVRRFGIDTRFVLRQPGRLGLYFVERGANQRASSVIYDRTGSLVCETRALDYDWDGIFKDCIWFHVSGITPAISRKAAEATILAVGKAKALGIMVSCDLNFRKKLWNWEQGLSAGKLAERTMGEILPNVDVVIGNEEDAQDIFGIQIEGNDIHGGDLAIAQYPLIASRVAALFPNIQKIAFTLRESISATHNNWGAMLFDVSTGHSWFAPFSDAAYKPYDIRAIVDRIGGGDSFAAGLIFAMNDPELSKDPSKSIAFATAASCLCHSIEGDFNYVTKEEVVALMSGDASGRVKR